MKESRGIRGGPASESPVPDATGRLLAALEERVGVDSVDRAWIFPPLVRGRKEWGLVAVSCLTEDPSKRTLVTGRYTAEITGQGVRFEHEIISQGLAPPERLTNLMDGVVRRCDLPLGLPREVEIGADVQKFRELISEFGLGAGVEEPPASRG